jgi:TM2 domain-containing membrane protein YozV
MNKCEKKGPQIVPYTATRLLDKRAGTGYSETVKSKGIAYILLIFAGVWGVHHFYLGRPGKGLLYLLTCGLFSLGVIYDFFTLGRQVDEANTRIYGSAFSGDRTFIIHQGQEMRPSEMAGYSAEKQILMLSSRCPVLTVRDVVAGTRLDVEEAEATLAKLSDRGIARLKVDGEGKARYDFG